MGYLHSLKVFSHKEKTGEEEKNINFTLGKRQTKK
jgi:hypothetical protein